MIKVIRDHPQLASIAWRQLVTECPHCEADSLDDYYFWYKDIDTIVLDNQQYSKPASFVIISNCPTCGEKSWNHFDLDNVSTLCDYAFEKEPEAFNAITNEFERRKKRMEQEWEDSLCKKCSKLQETSNRYLYYRVECCDGGISGHCTTDCDKFKPKE